MAKKYYFVQTLLLQVKMLKCKYYLIGALVMNNKIRTDAVDHLFDAILTLNDKEELYTFFEDVCTVNELLSLSQRYEVAKMLREKKTYLEIAEETGASTATISRVNRSLNYGNDGYDMVFKRLSLFEKNTAK